MIWWPITVWFPWEIPWWVKDYFVFEALTLGAAHKYRTLSQQRRKTKAKFPMVIWYVLWIMLWPFGVVFALFGLVVSLVTQRLDIWTRAWGFLSWLGAILLGFGFLVLFNTAIRMYQAGAQPQP